MTSEEILKDVLTITAEMDDVVSTKKIFEDAIVSAMAIHRVEVLDAFHEGEDQGFASGSAEGFKQGFSHD